MAKTRRSFALLTFLAVTGVAASGCESTMAEETRTRAMATALTLQDMTGEQALPVMSGGFDPLQVVMGSGIGDMVLDAWAAGLSGINTDRSSLGAGGIAAFAKIGKGGEANVPGIHGGVGDVSVASRGLPTGPTSSLGDFAAELCELTAVTCDRVLTCVDDDSVCSAFISQVDCRSTFEDGLRQRGVTSAPGGLMAKLRCARQRMEVAACASTPSDMLHSVSDSCQ